MNTSSMFLAEGFLAEGWSRVRSYIIRDYLRKWAALGVLIGVVAGLGAIVFYVAIDRSTWLFLGQIVGYAPPQPRGEGETIWARLPVPG